MTTYRGKNSKVFITTGANLSPEILAAMKAADEFEVYTCDLETNRTGQMITDHPELKNKAVLVIDGEVWGEGWPEMDTPDVRIIHADRIESADPFKGMVTADYVRPATKEGNRKERRAEEARYRKRWKRKR